MNLNVGDVFYHKNINSNLKRGTISKIGRKYIYVVWVRDTGGGSFDYCYAYKYTKDRFEHYCILMGDPVYDS